MIKFSSITADIVKSGNVHAYNQHPPTHIHCKAYRKPIDVNVPSVKYDTLNPNETVLIIIPINDIIPQNIVLKQSAIYFKLIFYFSIKCIFLTNPRGDKYSSHNLLLLF